MVGHGVAIADEFVQIRLGGDMALFAGLGRLLLEAQDEAGPDVQIVDRDFVATHCADFDAYARRTRAVDLDTVLAGHRRRARAAASGSRRCWPPPSAPWCAGRWA